MPTTPARNPPQTAATPARTAPRPGSAPTLPSHSPMTARSTPHSLSGLRVDKGRGRTHYLIYTTRARELDMDFEKMTGIPERPQDESSGKRSGPRIPLTKKSDSLRKDFGILSKSHIWSQLFLN